MVYISKVYTRSGDKGDTMLASGERVGKDTQRIRSYGEIDELNAVVGLVRTEIWREPKRAGHEAFLAALDLELERIQQELFDLGGELATASAFAGEPKFAVGERHITRLETDMDAWNETLAPLKSFVLPGGGAVGAMCHLARTVCRRAERELVGLSRTETIRFVTVRYVNRLSDYFFVVGRAVTHTLGYQEVLWTPGST
jgi:cob(I)alamin adenosyltransferase